MSRGYLFSFLLGWVVLFSPKDTQAQYINFGYRAHVGGMGSYKNIVDFYNDNRPWLDNQFSATGYMQGIEFGLAGSTEEMGFSAVKLYFVYSKTRAKGTFNNVEYKRTLRNRIFGVEPFDFWITPIHLGDFNIGGGVMPIGLGVYRTKTWLKGEETENIPLSDLESHNLAFVSSFHAYVSPHIDFTFLLDGEQSFHLQLFYSFGPRGEYDLYYLNRTLNPATHTNFNQRTLLKINNAGFKLSYSF